MIITIATAWSASNGGINAFNIELTRALARTRKFPVLCAVTAASDEQIASAANDGVTLVKVAALPDGKPSPEAVAEDLAQALGDKVVLWVGHDLVSGEASVRGARLYGGQLALIHHMDYQSYQNFPGDRGNDTYQNNDRQARLFQTPTATLFGVGSWLAKNAARLGNRDDVHTLIPGFPAKSGAAARINADRLLVVSAGRFDTATEPLKRIGAGLEGFATALRDGNDLALLRTASMTLLGVDDPEAQRELCARAERIAGRPVVVVPARFSDDPSAVADLASRSHLVIVPSRHEGFGLVGWEAIGTETPLIIGADTGLADQLRTTLDGLEEGLVSILDLNGTDGDHALISEAVKKIAANLPRAMKRSKTLRSQLSAELDCTWASTAETLLKAVGLSGPQPSNGPIPTIQPATFSDLPVNLFEHCVELRASAAQGSTRRSLELIAELRFGVTEIEVDDIEAQLMLEQAALQVMPRTGKIAIAERLGEGNRAVAGIEARAGGLWLIRPTDGGSLVRKVLGDESLCVIESVGEHPTVVDLEVTAARRHIQCILRSKRRLSKNVEKVIGVFLKDCICKPESGHIVFSSLTLSEEA